MLEREKIEDNYWTLCYCWCVKCFNEENPFILIIEARWLNVQLCPMKKLLLTHFSPSKPLSKSTSVNFDFIWGDMRHTYFNVHILPLGHLGIVKRTFLVTDIFKGTFCFYLGLSVYNKFTLALHVIFGILCHHLTPEKSICVSCQGKKLRSKWSDTSGSAVSLFPFLLLSPFSEVQLKRQVRACSCLLHRDRNWITMKRLEIFGWRVLIFYIKWELWGISHAVQFFLKTTLRNWIRG